MKEPTFDRYGYPTEETLDVLKDWEYQPDRPVAEQAKEWLEYARACWNYADLCARLADACTSFTQWGGVGTKASSLP